MVISFLKMEEKALPNFKGGEKQYDVKMFVEGDNKIMRGRLEPGASIGLHTHETDCEIIFITAGKGTVIEDGNSQRVEPEMALYCPKGHAHTLINDGEEDLCFFAAVLV